MINTRYTIASLRETTVGSVATLEGVAELVVRDLAATIGSGAGSNADQIKLLAAHTATDHVAEQEIFVQVYLPGQLVFLFLILLP